MALSDKKAPKPTDVLPHEQVVSSGLKTQNENALQDLKDPEKQIPRLESQIEIKQEAISKFSDALSVMKKGNLSDVAKVVINSSEKSINLLNEEISVLEARVTRMKETGKVRVNDLKAAVGQKTKFPLAVSETDTRRAIKAPEAGQAGFIKTHPHSPVTYG